MIIVNALAVGGHLEVVYKKDFLRKVKMTVARSFPDQKALRRGDGSVIQEHVNQLHLEQRRSVKQCSEKANLSPNGDFFPPREHNALCKKWRPCLWHLQHQEAIGNY